MTRRRFFKFKNVKRTVFSVGAIALFYVLTTVLYIRWDLTLTGRYSLAEFTRTTVAELKEPLTIKAYFSKNLPPVYQEIATQSRDTISEFARASSGNLRVEYIDPLEEAQRSEANANGVPEAQVQVYQKDNLAVQKGFLGLAVTKDDKHESIPFIQDVQNLEYQILSAITKVQTDVTPSIGFLQGHDEHGFSSGGERDDYQSVRKLLEQNYRVLPVNLSAH